MLILKLFFNLFKIIVNLDFFSDVKKSSRGRRSGGRSFVAVIQSISSTLTYDKKLNLSR